MFSILRNSISFSNFLGHLSLLFFVPVLVSPTISLSDVLNVVILLSFEDSDWYPWPFWLFPWLFLTLTQGVLLPRYFVMSYCGLTFNHGNVWEWKAWPEGCAPLVTLEFVSTRYPEVPSNWDHFQLILQHAGTRIMQLGKMQTLMLCEHRSVMTDSQERPFLSLWAEAPQTGFLVAPLCWSVSSQPLLSLSVQPVDSCVYGFAKWLYWSSVCGLA